jgi:hypothetical protein
MRTFILSLLCPEKFPLSTAFPQHASAGLRERAACTYGILGRKAEALDTLKKAFAAGYSNQNWVARDSDLDCLHDDPEFRKLVGLSEAPFPPACSIVLSLPGRGPRIG